MSEPSHLRGCFVTGTDTGVGKSVVTAAIVSALRADGTNATACKPVMTGIDDPPDPDWGRDDELLARASGRDPQEVTALRFGPPASPHLAADLAGAKLDPDIFSAQVRTTAAGYDTVIVEGVGGLLVPLVENYLVRDLAVALGLPLVIAARPGLGTINHTLLTVEAARAVGLEVRAVVFTPWPESPSTIERSNSATVRTLGKIDVRHLPNTTPDRQSLAASGQLLECRSLTE